MQHQIRQDTLTVINHCESQEELDFLFPEITRIHVHDLAVLESWQNHVDWIQTMSPNERQLLATNIPTIDNLDNYEVPGVAPEE